MSTYSRSCRLITKKDFQFVFEKPFKSANKYLLVLYRPNLRETARLGLVIAKHHVKRAVDRNLLRRVIRESFRHQSSALKGLDIIILLRSEWSPSDKRALREDIDKLWAFLIKS